LNYRERAALIGKAEPSVPLSRQAELMDISRSSIYYQPKIDPEDILIMNAIDEIFTACPFYGHRRIREDLKAEHEIFIGRKRTLSLMKEMGLEAIYPKKKLNLSLPDSQHKKFPYLLTDVKIIKPNQVWGTDITYIRMKNGFAYLTAILDWFSRYVIAWRLSPTLENDFCIQALKEALKINIPNFHNSDQGSQFTSFEYLEILEQALVNISMDGRGRCMDNIFTERLWRTVKYENVYLNDYLDYEETHYGLSEYFTFYNEKRKHQSLNYKAPAQIYFAK